MAHSPTYEVRVRREIRNALAIDPIATIPELTEPLNKRLSHSFDPRYIKKLTDKVAHQLIIESDRLRIEDRMKVTRENRRIVREELQAVLHSGAPSKDRVPVTLYSTPYWSRRARGLRCSRLKGLFRPRPATERFLQSVCAVHLAGPSNAGIGTDQQRRPCIDGEATYPLRTGCNEPGSLPLG
jgi:hypothetical protein